MMLWKHFTARLIAGMHGETPVFHALPMPKDAGLKRHKGEKTPKKVLKNIVPSLDRLKSG